MLPRPPPRPPPPRPPPPRPPLDECLSTPPRRTGTELPRPPGPRSGRPPRGFLALRIRSSRAKSRPAGWAAGAPGPPGALASASMCVARGKTRNCHVSSQNQGVSPAKSVAVRTSQPWRTWCPAGAFVCPAGCGDGRSYARCASLKRPGVPGSPPSPLATRTPVNGQLLLGDDHHGVLSPLAFNALLSPGRTPRKLTGSAVRVPARSGDAAVQHHDGAPSGSVTSLAQVKAPKRCAPGVCAALLLRSFALKSTAEPCPLPLSTTPSPQRRRPPGQRGGRHPRAAQRPAGPDSRRRGVRG